MRCALVKQVAITTSLIGLTSLIGSTGRAEDWPQFRGPDGQGHAVTTGLPTEWSETENVVWKTDIPGRGWSSPVVQDSQIWLTTALVEMATEEEKETRLEGNDAPIPLEVANRVKLHAICVHKESGVILHNVPLFDVGQPDPIHPLNSYASPSPVIENSRVYCHFGTNGTACVDTEMGDILWSNCELKLNHETGAGSSPILWNSLFIVHCDGSDAQYIAALDQETGKLVWKTPRSGKLRENGQLKKSYGTPLVLSIDGSDVLLSPASDWVYGYDPATGEELWKLNYGVMGFSTVPRPVMGSGMVYICTGFMRSELLALRLTDRHAAPEVAWRFKKQVPTMPSPVVMGNEIYFVSDQGGVVTCLDTETGSELWRERLGGNFCASPLYADGHLFFSSREGLTHVIRAGRTFQRVAENQLESGIMASAAALDGALFVRTEEALYRLEAGKGGAREE